MSTSSTPALREWSADAHHARPTPRAPRTLIRGARVLDPATRFDQIADVLIDDGLIAAIGPALDASDAHIIDGAGAWLIPGLVDLAVRFREPGASDKASFVSETPAAFASGITQVVIAPDTTPVLDTPAMISRVRRIARQAGTLDVYVLGALTRKLEGQTLAEMSALQRAGVVGVSNAWAPLTDARVARRALDYAKGLDLTVHIQPQDAALSAGGCAHEGVMATRLGLAPIPIAAEVAALRFWISLVEDTGARVHFGRLSTARGVELIDTARRQGLPISADVAAHQLHLTDRDIDGFNALCHVLPPLRSADDRDALREAVRLGIVSAVCSDHQPHEADAKINPFALTEPGISALETLLPLTLALVHSGELSPLEAIARLSYGPALIAGLDAGRLRVGACADLALVDPDQQWTLRADALVSAGHNTPWIGRSLQGRVRACWRRGQSVFVASA